VNYDANPQKVIEVIESAAKAHPSVLKKPPPKVLLVGFGDSAINFELRAWTDKFSDWAQVKSEIAVAVYDVIRASGFSFPFPQREVRLLDNAPP
jgi:small-conductance mechanosensitive channel